MKALAALLLVAGLSSLGFSQTDLFPRHTTKSGHSVRQHKSKRRKSEDEVRSEMTSKGRHREHRTYPGHYAKDGHWVKPHSQWVWVKD